MTVRNINQTHALYLVAGLGNPGSNYQNTRHNAGFMVIDALARKHAIELDKKRFETAYGKGRIQGRSVLLAQPMAYMNRSGPPLRRLADYYRISGEDMLVVHDDIDLAFGRLKIKEKGGHGGHKGIMSLTNAFGGGNFIRLRIGVGRGDQLGEKHDHVVQHVLGIFSPAEKEILDKLIDLATQAVVTILIKGVAEGMNRFNDKKGIISR